MDASQPKIINECDVLVVDKLIAKVAKTIKDKANNVLDCTNKYVMPGLINCHTHVSMSIFKESVDGLNLQDWLKQFIWPIEKKLDNSLIYQTSLYGMYEFINNGVTTINDMYFLTDSIVKAAKDSGINFLGNDTLLDVDQDGQKRYAKIVNNINKYPCCCGVIPIHGLYSCSGVFLKKAVELAIKKQLPIHMHFCENVQEIKDIKKNHHDLPLNVIKKYFMHVPQLILAHCVKLDEKTINYLAKIKASIVHNPTSNLRLGCGIANINKYLNKGINVCLGTDGSGSGSNGDLFKEIRLACMLQKGNEESPKIMTAYDGLKLATINGAKALNKNKGMIAIGKDADLLIIDLHKTLQTQPLNDPISDIVYNVTDQNIETVIINGKIIKNKYRLVKTSSDVLIKKCNLVKQKIFKN